MSKKIHKPMTLANQLRDAIRLDKRTTIQRSLPHMVRFLFAPKSPNTTFDCGRHWVPGDKKADTEGTIDAGRVPTDGYVVRGS